METPSIFNRIEADLTSARRGRFPDLRDALSFLLAELKDVKINKRLEVVPDAEVISTLQKQLKMRQDTLQAAVEGNRPEAAAKARYEIDIIHTYLPKAPCADEVEAEARKVISETNAEGMKAMGGVIKAVAERLPAVDKGQLSGIVKKLLMA